MIVYCFAIFLGPDHWGDDCNLENKNKQSPINIKTAKAEYDEDLEAFTLSGYDAVDGTMVNNGHTGKTIVGVVSYGGSN